MSIVSPETKGRANINVQGDKLYITIPSKIKFLRTVFLSIFSLQWIVMATVIVTEFIPEILKEGVMTDAIPFIIIWLGIFLPFGFIFIFLLSWNIFGKENIIISNKILKIHRKILGIGSEKEYYLSEINNIRISNQRFYFSFKNIFEGLGYGGGVISFDYGMKTISFANSIEEAEGGKLINKISEWKAK